MTKNYKSSSTPSDTTISLEIDAKGGGISQKPTMTSLKPERIQSWHSELSKPILTKLLRKRYSNGLQLLNLKFGAISQVAYQPPRKKSELAIITSDLGEFIVSVSPAIPQVEYIECPNGKTYVTFWKTPYIGIILKELDSEDSILETIELYQRAMLIELSPETVEEIKIPTAGKGINSSIKKLASEAYFLKKKILASEVMDCAVRVKQNIYRAARVHQDVLPAIFSAARRQVEVSLKKDGVEKRTIRKTARPVHAGSCKLPSMRKKRNGVPSFQGKKQVSSGHNNMDRPMCKLPPKSPRQPKVGKRK